MIILRLNSLDRVRSEFISHIILYDKPPKNTMHIVEGNITLMLHILSHI